MRLSIEVLRSVEEIPEQDILRWNELARNPFQRWEWLGSWWSSYQEEYLLHILSVKRNNETIAFAPWCMDKRLLTGRTLQFLGSGKACTDHLSLLVDPTDTQVVCDALARWAAEGNAANQADLPRQLVWDAIELIGVDKTDEPINCLVNSMRKLGLAVIQTEGVSCYAIDLPPSWDEYVTMRSKSGRREIRQAQQCIDNGTIVLHSIRDRQELETFWDQFVVLHQRRRQAAGTSGCFDDPRFGVFLRRAATRLLDAGMLELVVASIDGAAVATQLAVADDDCWYFYQSGMDPDYTDRRPGLNVLCHTIRKTIESGRRRYDMLRGDEPYKLRWRAELQPTQEIRVCSPRRSAKVRNLTYNALVTVKNLVTTSDGLWGS